MSAEENTRLISLPLNTDHVFTQGHRHILGYRCLDTYRWPESEAYPVIGPSLLVHKALGPGRNFISALIRRNGVPSHKVSSTPPVETLKTRKHATRLIYPTYTATAATANAVQPYQTYSVWEALPKTKASPTPSTHKNHNKPALKKYYKLYYQLNNANQTHKTIKRTHFNTLFSQKTHTHIIYRINYIFSRNYTMAGLNISHIDYLTDLYREVKIDAQIKTLNKVIAEVDRLLEEQTIISDRFKNPRGLHTPKLEGTPTLYSNLINTAEVYYNKQGKVYNIQHNLAPMQVPGPAYTPTPNPVAARIFQHVAISSGPGLNFPPKMLAGSGPILEHIPTTWRSTTPAQGSASPPGLYLGAAPPHQWVQPAPPKACWYNNTGPPTGPVLPPPTLPAQIPPAPAREFPGIPTGPAHKFPRNPAQDCATSDQLWPENNIIYAQFAPNFQEIHYGTPRMTNLQFNNPPGVSPLDTSYPPPSGGSAK